MKEVILEINRKDNADPLQNDVFQRRIHIECQPIIAGCPDHFEKAFKGDEFDQIAVGAVITAHDVNALVSGGGEYHRRDPLEHRRFFDGLKNVDSAHPRQLDVQQHQIGQRVRAAIRIGAAPQQVAHRFFARFYSFRESGGGNRRRWLRLRGMTRRCSSCSQVPPGEQAANRLSRLSGRRG